MGPRGPRSVSTAVADAFLQAYRKVCRELTVDTRALGLARQGCNIAVAAKSVESSDRLPGSIYTVGKEVETLGAQASIATTLAAAAWRHSSIGICAVPVPHREWDCGHPKWLESPR
jgi:hypothetical protein